MDPSYLLGNGFQYALDGFRMEHWHFDGVKTKKKNSKRKQICCGNVRPRLISVPVAERNARGGRVPAR